MVETITRNEIMKKLGNFNRVENMRSARGNDTPNQFTLYFENGEVFQSYSSIIAVKFYGEETYYLGDDWDYSNTTGKYRNDFLRSYKKDVQDDLKSGSAVHVKGL